MGPTEELAWVVCSPPWWCYVQESCAELCSWTSQKWQWVLVSVYLVYNFPTGACTQLLLSLYPTVSLYSVAGGDICPSASKKQKGSGPACHAYPLWVWGLDFACPSKGIDCKPETVAGKSLMSLPFCFQTMQYPCYLPAPRLPD